MRKALFGLLLLALAALSTAVSAAGVWNVTTTGPGPTDEFQWTLTIKEQDGQLTGTMTGEMGEFKLEDLKYSGGALTAKITIDAQSYAIDTKIDGDTMEGKWNAIGAEMGGKVKGARKAS